MKTVWGMMLVCMMATAGCVTTSDDQLMKAHGAAEFWRVDFSLARGNAQWCVGSIGGAGVGVKEQHLAIAFRPTDLALVMPLNADGSAQGDVMMEWSGPAAGKEMVRLTVPPGTGPRELELLTLRSNCTYRVIPRVKA